MSEEFTKVIPVSVQQAAEAEFEKMDRPTSYPDVQREIGKKLLKLRISFQENTSAAPEANYFTDFKLIEANKGTVILLQGEKNTNLVTGNWNGIAGIKARYLENMSGVTVHTINVQNWRQL